MSITSASTASAGAVRSSSIGARPTRRPFVHTATTTALSKLDPRIPSNTARHALGPSNGHVANRVSGGGADRLVELLGQTGVRKRVSRYLMTSHSVIPSHAGHCRTGLWASLAMGHEKRPEPPPVGGTVTESGHDRHQNRGREAVVHDHFSSDSGTKLRAQLRATARIRVNPRRATAPLVQ
jgi:hypothetical protein